MADFPRTADDTTSVSESLARILGAKRPTSDTTSVTETAFTFPPWRLYRRFDIGSMGTSTLTRIFDVEHPPASSTLSRVFDIGTAGSRSTLTRVFDIEGPAASRLVRIFDIVTAQATVDPGEDIGTVIPAPSYSVSTTLASGSTAGATTITVTDAVGITPGMLLNIGGEIRAVESVAGTTVTLSAPLGYSHTSGTGVSAAFGFVPGLMVFDKAGNPLGVITRYELAESPTMMLGAMGSFGFWVSRMNPESALIQGDRLIAFQFRPGGSGLWAGNMEADEAATSVIRVTVPDVFSLLTNCPISVSETPLTPITAAGAYIKAIAAANEQKARDGEIQWAVLNQGASNLFYGGIDWQDDPLDALGEIAQQSFTEFRWVATIGTDGKLALTLYVDNEFAIAGGAAITDGVGGNVTGEPRWVRDAAPIRNGLKLQGLGQALSDYLPDWAQWAVDDIRPEAEVFVDPGDYRRRVDKTLSVGFGFSPAILKTMADQILAELWAMYGLYLTAFHDQYGRVFHEGWSYEGPPSDIEPFLHTGLGWRTRRRLVEMKGQPASVVMVSQREQQVVAVTYNRVTEEYKARRYWSTEQEGVLYVVHMSIHGWTTWFDGAEGGVLTGRHLRTAFDHSSAIVSGNAVKMPYRYTDDNGNPQTLWYTVRRVVSLSEDGAVTEGAYFVMQTPSGPTTGPQFVKPTIGDDPYLRLTLVPREDPINYDEGLISKMFSMEKGRIRDWDPRRDGVGVWTSKKHVHNNAEATDYHWYIKSFGIGAEGTTSLAVGAYASDTLIYVDSVFSLPRLGTTWDGMIQVGLDPVIEYMKVTAISGNRLTVQRARNGTPAIVHEAGTSVAAMGVDERSMFEYLWQNIEWTEGQDWALRALSKLSKPFIRASIQVSNRNATWSNVRLGSLHAVTITTEGLGTLTGTFRCIGLSPDATTGKMEVILEWREP